MWIHNYIELLLVLVTLLSHKYHPSCILIVSETYDEYVELVRISHNQTWYRKYICCLQKTLNIFSITNNIICIANPLQIYWKLLVWSPSRTIYSKSVMHVILVLQAENLIAHRAEIYSRPKRTWFVTEKEKKLNAKAAKVSFISVLCLISLTVWWRFLFSKLIWLIGPVGSVSLRYRGLALPI